MRGGRLLGWLSRGSRRVARSRALAATMGQGQAERIAAILATTRRCRENDAQETHGE